jgi:hypothetical protein
MNDASDDTQTDDDVLTYEVSDEVLEAAAAGTGTQRWLTQFTMHDHVCCF